MFFLLLLLFFWLWVMVLLSLTAEAYNLTMVPFRSKVTVEH